MTFLSGRATGANTWRMEQFSWAYVQAVASAAACSIQRVDFDYDSIDLNLKRRTLSGPFRCPQIDVQLKATSTDCLYDGEVRYPLPVKNYNDLRGSDYLMPRILIVVLVPAQIEEWLEHDETHLLLRRCGYWVSLQGAPEVPNTSSVTVRLPRTQPFDAAGLDSMFRRVTDGGRP